MRPKILRPGDGNRCNTPIGDSPSVLYNELAYHASCISAPIRPKRWRPRQDRIVKLKDPEAAANHWWWIESSESFAQFSMNPIAQGYEVLKRTRRFQRENFFAQAKHEARVNGFPGWTDIPSDLH